MSRFLIWSTITRSGSNEVSVMALVVVVVFALGIILLGSLMLIDRRTKSF